MKYFALEKLSRMILAELNINFIRNKFDLLSDGIAGNVVSMKSETKIDDMFPLAKSFVAGYAPPYRLDRNCKGGDLLYSRGYPLKVNRNKQFRRVCFYRT